jgi:hypothetical protein
MAPRWFKSRATCRAEQAEAEESRRLERNRVQTQSWMHRIELLNESRMPFNPQRKRDLEYPLPLSASPMQQTFEQQQSSFVQLPAELRLQIYRYLFSGRTINLYVGFWAGDWRGGRLGNVWQSDGRLSKQNLPNQWHFYHSICLNDERYAPVAPHWHCKSIKSLHKKCFYVLYPQVSTCQSFEPCEPQKIGAMSLLLSCRKV